MIWLHTIKSYQSISYTDKNSEPTGSALTQTGSAFALPGFSLAPPPVMSYLAVFKNTFTKFLDPDMHDFQNLMIFSLSKEICWK